MKRGVIALAVLLAASACSGGTKHSANRHSLAPQPQHEVASATLESCPSSDVHARNGKLAVVLPCLGSGPAVDIAGLRGRPTVVNLWAGWCGPCQQELPALQRSAQRLAGKVRFVGVVTDDERSDALRHAGLLGVHYPSVFDPDGKLRRRLGLPGPPATLFLDASGKLVGTLYGEFNVRRLDSYIVQFLGVRA